MTIRSHRWLLALACAAALGLSACGDSASAYPADQSGHHDDGTSGGSGGEQATSGASDRSGEPTHGTMSVSVLPVDPATNPFAADHLDPNGWPGRSFPPIHVFGKRYEGKFEATLMMRPLTVGIPVVAPFDGAIQEVRDQPESCDTEMYLNDGNHDQTNHASLDHVTPLPEFTTPGATFHAGQTIGTVPRWQCKEDFGGVEFMVVSNTDQGVQASCPLLLLDPAKRDSILAAISAVQDRWNATGAPSAYSPAELGAGLCATEHTSAR